MRRYVRFIQNFCVVASGMLATIAIFVEVVSRYGFNKPVFGADELAGFAAVWFYFLGAAAAAEEGMHISASLTNLFIKNKQRQLLFDILVDILSAGAATWMSAWCWQFFWWSLVNGKMSLELGVPMPFFNVVLPIGMSLIAIYHCLDCLEHVRAFRHQGRLSPGAFH